MTGGSSAEARDSESQGTDASDPGAPTGLSSAPTGEDGPRTSSATPPVRPIQSRRKLPSWVYVAGAVTIVIAVVLSAWTLSGGLGHSSGSTNSTTKVLVTQWTLYTLPGGQFNGIDFTVTSSAVVNGTIDVTNGVVLYTMSPQQYQTWLKTGAPAGYSWTSGTIASWTLTSLEIAVSAGLWVLVFANPNTTNTTMVDFFTDLTLEPS